MSLQHTRRHQARNCHRLDPQRQRLQTVQQHPRIRAHIDGHLLDGDALQQLQNRVVIGHRRQ